MMVGEFYDAVMVKTKCNLKYNWTVSFMETRNSQKEQENQQKVQLAYTQIIPK